MMMQMDPEGAESAILMAAMDVVLTWGPERSIPEADRLRDHHPEITDSQVQAALAEAWRVMGQAESFAPDIKRGISTNAHEILRRDRPWLTEDQASRAISQGLYSHWRDTGE
jgi:hypothetical protein